MGQLLKGGYVVNGKECFKADVRIKGEKIDEVGEDLEEKDDEVIDVTGKILFPGFIDSHTHFDLEVSGGVTADDFSTGTVAALSGGTTCILDFATQERGETLKYALEHWHEKADGNSSCDYGFHMAISSWNKDVEKEIDEMIESGVPTFKLYMTYDSMYLEDDKIIDVLKKLKERGAFAGVHCENKSIIDYYISQCRKDNNMKPHMHYLSRPDEAEAEAINRLMYLASLAEAPVTVVHLSTKEGYEEIKRARARGVRVMVETCPQYLILDEDKYKHDEEQCLKYTIAPPLRNREDQEALWYGILHNDIQFIGTDHCSFTLKQKRQGIDDFSKIPCGMPGVELRAPLIHTFGVVERGISYSKMCQLLSENVAKLYGLYPTKGCIKAESDADIVVWDPDIKWVTTEDNQVANTDYNPYEGIELQGKAEKVFLRGKLAVDEGKVVLFNKGKYIPRYIRR